MSDKAGGPAVSSTRLFGLRVIGHDVPLPNFFTTEVEAKELRMRHRDHSPACLEVVRITVEPNAEFSGERSDHERRYK